MPPEVIAFYEAKQKLENELSELQKQLAPLLKKRDELKGKIHNMNEAASRVECYCY